MRRPLQTVVFAMGAVTAAAAHACGAGAAAAALQAPQVSQKFALAFVQCGSVHRPLAVVGQPERERMAEQLWLYDAPAAAVVAPRVMPAPPEARVEPAPARADAVPGQGMKGMSRDARLRALSLVPQISDVAARYRIDPLLLHAIAHVESRHNPGAVSHAGARGLMQVMPATARRFGVTAPASQLHDPKISLEVSSAYLKTLQKRFDNDLTLVIAAYNAGEGSVEKYGRKVPPYKETQGYVRDVLAHYRALLIHRDSVRTAPAVPVRAAL